MGDFYLLSLALGRGFGFLACEKKSITHNFPCLIMRAESALFLLEKPA